MSNQEVWILSAEANHRLVLQPHDLTYFQEYFVAKPIADTWKPPPVKIHGKTLPIRDFVQWSTSAPVISEKAREALASLVTEHCEILPFIQLRKQQYYALNVLTFLDCLDRAKSDIFYSPNDPKRIVNVSRFSLRKSAIPPDLPIFKIPEDPRVVFVTPRFVDVVRLHKLTGAQLVNADTDPLLGALLDDS